MLNEMVVMLLGRHAFGPQLAEEAAVAVAVDQVEDHVGLGRHDLGDDIFDVEAAERQILFADDRAAKLFQFVANDGAGGAGKDVVGADQEEPPFVQIGVGPAACRE